MPCGGKFTILVYGSGVNLVAVGKGTVKLAGMPDSPGDGDSGYSLNEQRLRLAARDGRPTTLSIRASG